MSLLPEAVSRFAEEPDCELDEPAPPSRRIQRPAFTLVLSPTPSHAAVSRVRTTAANLDATIAEVRAVLREAGYHGCAWYVSPASRPEGLGALLAQRGFVPATQPPFEPRYTAMVLSAPPPASPKDARIEARAVRDLDEYLVAMQVAMSAFNEGNDDATRWLEAAPAFWHHANGIARLTHIAYLDGRAVGFGFVSPGPSAVLLGGSGVLAEARGRGVYRALVASRWEEAVRLGKPALVIHAGAMSRPILERCGFSVVAPIDVFGDPTLR